MFLVPLVVFSQNDEFAKIRQQMYGEFHSFKDSINKEYEEFKKVVWQEFELVKTPERLKPKPKVVPIATKTPPIKEPKILFEDNITTISPNFNRKPTPLKVVPEVNLPEDDFLEKRPEHFNRELLRIKKERDKQIEVDFYGVVFQLFYDEMPLNISSNPDKYITDAVKVFSEKGKALQDMIYQWANYASIMNLNDYGFMRLVRKSAMKIYQHREQATILTWYVMNKVGYDCKITYAVSDKYLQIMVLSPTKLLNTPTISLNDKQVYYMIRFDKEDHNRKLERVYTYGKNPFDSTKKVDFVIKNTPLIDDESVIKERNCGKIGRIAFVYNNSYIDFLKELPSLDYQAYFEMPMYIETETKIKEIFEPLLRGKSTVERVRFLLNFMHSSFPYKFDSEHFGMQERPQSPEEMIYNNYSDCEDNSALFAYLVKTFTSCEVVGVLYSDHVAVAVRFKDERPNGYYLPAPYDDYLICDPTYFGADIGQSMPNYIGVMPEEIFKIRK